MDSIKDLFATFEEELKKAETLPDIEAMKVRYLGKKGPIQALMKTLGTLPNEEKPLFGKAINDLKAAIAATLQEKFDKLTKETIQKRLATEALDVTLPGRAQFSGHKHIIISTLDEMIDILRTLGFSVQYGPEVDSEYYNFEVLNFPEDHPARDMQDTFYITDKLLLRTHTSNVQARIMEHFSPPIRIIAPGKVFRNESITARSHVLFHQIEALVVDRKVSFTDLVATLEIFFERFFKRKVPLRFRPSYFPFVEPGMEVDIACLACGGSGCNLCKHTGWLEVAGAGMVHPEVLRNGGIDPEEYSGFAWGLGVERIAMLRHDIKDIRLFFENDVRFLAQFP